MMRYRIERGPFLVPKNLKAIAREYVWEDIGNDSAETTVYASDILDKLQDLYNLHDTITRDIELLEKLVARAYAKRVSDRTIDTVVDKPVDPAMAEFIRHKLRETVGSGD